GQDGRRRGAVPGGVVGLGGDLLGQLGPEVLVRVLQLHLLGDGHASLVMVGAPHFLSITTLRPRGPSVTLTVSASLSTPRSSERRASSSNSRILGITTSTYGLDRISQSACVRAPAAEAPGARAHDYFSMTASTSRAESTRYSSPAYFTSVPP